MSVLLTVAAAYNLPVLVWLQFHRYPTEWWEYLIIIGLAVLSAIVRGNYSTRRYGGWTGWTGGWTNPAGSGGGPGMFFGQAGAGLSPRNPLLRNDQRLTAPPMPDPAQAAADRYQRQLDTWMAERGMNSENPEHIRLALEANPYIPVPAGTALAGGPGLPPSTLVQQAPQQVQELLWLYDKPWWAAGGWALDLWLGHQTREHKDIEIAIPRTDQFALRTFMSQFRFSQVVPTAEGNQAAPLAAGEWVEQPVHELHAKRVTGASQEALPLMQLEVLLNEIENGVWRYRRDQRVSLPVAHLGGQSADGIPYLAPQIVLLYKAGLWRDGGPVSAQDDADFNQALPLLAPQAVHWLREAIATAHPGHPWLLVLNTPVYGN